jgi:hypothetical protein
MNDNQAICLKCGVAAGNGNSYCAFCGNPVNPDAVACLNCGMALKKTAGNLAGQDKVTMALICFFLGGLGVHNFYMGEKKKGIFRLVLSLCLSGLGGILALIDFIKILMGSYTYDPEKLF